MSQAIFVGVCGDRVWLNFFFPDLGAHAQVRNAKPELDEACRRFQLKTNYVFVLLSDRDQFSLCLARMCRHGLRVALVRPRDAYECASQIGKPDCLDAEVVSACASAGRAIEFDLNSAEALTDSLITRYFDVCHLLQFEESNLASAFHQEAQGFAQRCVTFLELQRSEVESRLAELLCISPLGQRKIEILRSASIEDWAILILLTRLPELGDASLEISRLAKITGLIPDAASGRGGVRELLFILTEKRLTSSPRLQAAYNKAISNGKVHKAAVIIAARKLITGLHICVRNDVLWNDNPDEDRLIRE